MTVGNVIFFWSKLFLVFLKEKTLLFQSLNCNVSTHGAAILRIMTTSITALGLMTFRMRQNIIKLRISDSGLQHSA